MSIISKIPEPRYLNLEYLFDRFFALLKKLLELIVYLFKLIGGLRVITVIISIILAAGIALIIRKLILLRQKKKITSPASFLAEEGEPKARFTKWDEIKKRLDSPNPSDWHMAIIEADSIIDDIFGKIGLKGDGLGEKLKSVEPSDFDNLQNVWDAHKVRNKIAHLGAGFELSKEDAKSVIGKYEKGLKELRYL